MSLRTRSLPLLVVVAAMLMASTTMATAASPGRPGGASPALIADSAWGYVVVRHPNDTYEPASRDQGNSAGERNSVIWTEKGHYEVTLSGLGQHAGVAHVSPLGSVARRCVISSVFVNVDDVVIDLACFKLDGQTVDSTFVLTFLAPATDVVTDASSPAGAGPGLAFVIDDQPNATYVPSVAAGNSYNSAGQPNSIDHLSAGFYRLSLAGVGVNPGNVQISALGMSAATCAVSWSNVDPYLVAFVECRHHGLALADQRFMLTFTDHLGLKGGGTHEAYLLADRPKADTYKPAAATRFSSAGKTSKVTRLAKGRYSVTVPGMPAGGAAVVSPDTSHSEKPLISVCSVSSISQSTPQKVGVRCFDGNGDSADRVFSLSYLR